MADDCMKLRCLVDGEATVFNVEAPSRIDVDELKRIIKKELSPQFNNIARKDLTLWSVAIPLGPKKDRKKLFIDHMDEDSKTELDEAKPLHEAFENRLQANAINVIVQGPPEHAPVRSPSPQSLEQDSTSYNLQIHIKKITDKFFAPGSGVATFLDLFVRGLKDLPLTKGSVPGLPRIWLRNNDPIDEARPSLLISDLPRSSSSGISSGYPTSDAILQLIERCSISGYTVPVFGVSGCGKTRGLIELLSLRWGFYFNAAADDLGSGDMTKLRNTVARLLQKGPKDRDANNRLGRAITYLLLLSRLKILQHCLAIPECHRTFTGARWTVLQTSPYVLHSDIFERLFECFLPILTYYQAVDTEQILVEVVQGEFQITRQLLEGHAKQGGIPSFSDSDKLLVVHDEAQILGNFWSGHFSSMSQGEPDRPLLSPILWGFRAISEANLTLMAAGTGLSIYTLDWARSSGADNKSTRSLNAPTEFEYMEFPGWTDCESIVDYVAGLRRLLRTRRARRALKRLLPLKVIQAISEKFIGRFRPAVSTIEKIIAKGDPEGWRKALDETEEILVSYDYRKSRGNLCGELIRLENEMRDNLSIFKDLLTIEEVLGLLLFQRRMFGADKLVLKDAMPELVERAFGRIKIVNGLTRTVIDEPFVLKAAKNYFDKRDSDFMNTLESWTQQSDKPQAHGYAWELMMMSVLTEAFKSHTFSEWPHTPSILSQSAKLAGNMRIVGLDEQGPRRGISHDFISMKEFMNAHVNTNSLWQGRPVPPFFFPKANPSGPDIVFFIQGKSGLFPVFAQLKLRQVLTRADAKDAVKTVSAPAVETHVEDLGRYCPDNTFISMIIAYPTTVAAKLSPRPVPSYNLRTRPGTEDTCPTQVTVIIDNDNISKIFPQSHVDFLDGIKTPVKRPINNTDDTEAESPKKARLKP